VGTRNLNKPTDMCKFRSSQKDTAGPLADFWKSFTVNRKVSIADVQRFIFLELMPAA